MPRTLSSNNQTGVVAATPQPVWLFEMSFSTPLRLSSRETMDYDGDTYTAGHFAIDLTPPTVVVSIFDVNLTISTNFISEGSSGIAVQLIKCYGAGPFSAGDGDVWHSGVAGPSKRRADGWVDVPLYNEEPRRSPRFVATDDIFSHLPPDGLEVQTNAGTFVMRRNI